MPEEEPIERAHEDEREGKSPSTQAGEFVREEMEHIREGEHGARSPEQAIAIGLSKARRAGVKLPPPKRGKQRTKRQAKRDLTKDAPDAARSLLGNGPAQRNARLNARAVAQHQGRHCRDTRSAWRGNALYDRVRLPPRKQRARGSAGAEM